MFIWKDITQDPEKQERPTKWVGPFLHLINGDLLDMLFLQPPRPS